eukprot:1708311-Pleurochrysis_carterae.AAC.1
MCTFFRTASGDSFGFGNIGNVPGATHVTMEHFDGIDNVPREANTLIAMVASYFSLGEIVIAGVDE